MNRSTVTYDRLSGLSLENSILPPAGVRRPRRGVLPMQEHDVEVFGIREFAKFVEFFLRIDTLMRGDLGHDAVTVARNAFQRDAEHLVHVGVGFCGFEEANAAVVGVTDQPGKSVLS